MALLACVALGTISACRPTGRNMSSSQPRCRRSPRGQRWFPALFSLYHHSVTNEPPTHGLSRCPWAGQEAPQGSPSPTPEQMPFAAFQKVPLGREPCDSNSYRTVRGTESSPRLVRDISETFCIGHLLVSYLNGNLGSRDSDLNHFLGLH